MRHNQMFQSHTSVRPRVGEEVDPPGRRLRASGRAEKRAAPRGSRTPGAPEQEVVELLVGSKI